MKHTPNQKPLLTREFILSNKKPYVPVSGVYFLIFEGEVVYVGQSIDCHARLHTHSQQRRIPFDSYYMTEVPVDRLMEMESEYIVALKPRYNSSIAFGERYCVLSTFLAEYGEIIGDSQVTVQRFSADIRAHGITPSFRNYYRNTDVRSFLIARADEHGKLDSIYGKSSARMKAEKKKEEFFKRKMKDVYEPMFDKSPLEQLESKLAQIS